MIRRISEPAIDSIIQRAVATATECSGGPLSTFHERYSPAKAKQLKESIVPFVKELTDRLADDEDLVQVNPNLRIHQPHQNSSVPFHSDTLYGHSHEEINYWLALTPTYGTNSLWMAPDPATEDLHALLRSGTSLSDFDRIAQSKASPIETQTPGLFTFCCSQIHGSVLNTTAHTRLSVDFRILPKGARANVKRNGYFRPKWLPNFPCPMTNGQLATTVATLDLAVPAHMQRQLMQAFYPQHGHRELVEFHNLDHSPTLDMAVKQGPTVAYSIAQVKKPFEIIHPIGFADENVWFTRENQGLFEKLWSSQKQQ